MTESIEEINSNKKNIMKTDEQVINNSEAKEKLIKETELDKFKKEAKKRFIYFKESIEEQKDKKEKFITNISSEAEINLFLGAGHSMPYIPGMKCILKEIKETDEFKKIKETKELTSENLEDVLNEINILKISYKKMKEIYKDDKKYQDSLELVELLWKKTLDIIKDKINKDRSDTKIIGYKQTYDKYLFIHKFLYFTRINRNILNPFNIFTTNYDLVNEWVMEDLNLNYTTGFTGDVSKKFNLSIFNLQLVDDTNRYNEKILDSNIYQVKLYKIHGSINWYSSNENNEEIIQKNIN